MPPNTNPASDQYSQLVERLGSANNVLITVNADPSVDQLAACIGLTLALNKQGKHATAVFSGKVPSTLEFLQPEKTIEKNTDSLRDFIISLDKSKADKLRYKVEDEFVKIFITPYKTSIDDKDLTFSQGDFNIDLIITLGVHERNHLDQAIIAHGRILHDATVASINNDTISELGSISWLDSASSSLCEMVADLVNQIGKELFDAQIATALLTGMVAETDRFGNEKARPHTMSISGLLMAAGASPQLISNKLEEPEPEPEPEPAPEPEEPEVSEPPSEEIPALVPEEPAPEPEPTPEEPEPEPEPAPEPSKNDGMIEIDHTQEDNILIDEHGKLQAVAELEAAQAELAAEAARMEEESKAAEAAAQAELAQTEEATNESSEQPEQVSNESESQTETPGDQSVPGRGLVFDPPQLGGQLTANSVPEEQQYSPSTDPLSVASPQPLLDRTQPQAPEEPTPPEAEPKEQTLSDLERAVNSLHVTDDNGDPIVADASLSPSSDPVPPPPSLDEARAAVEQAVDSVDSYRPEPINALGATPLDINFGRDGTTDNPADEQNQNDAPKPPPVPPPMMPPGM